MDHTTAIPLGKSNLPRKAFIPAGKNVSLALGGSLFLDEGPPDHLQDVQKQLEQYAEEESSQSTALLHKKKAMKEVQAELDEKKADFDRRMRICDGRERALKFKQERAKEQVARFERFVKENEAKRQRALKKEKEEVTQRRQKEAEAARIQLDLQNEQRHLKEQEKKLARLSVCQRYLEGFLEQCSEFEEIGDVLRRHATLTSSNRDLQTSASTSIKMLEEMRGKLAAYTKDAENTMLTSTSVISDNQKKLELLKGANAKLDLTQAFHDAQRNQRARELGEAKMAIMNLYQRCRTVSGKSLAIKDTDNPMKVLVVIMERLLDFQELTRSSSSK